MNTGIFGEGFPYSNFHDLNMDWIIKIAKDFLDQYTHIQEIIEQGKLDIQELTTSGLDQLQDKADELENLLDEWYETHSNDIATQLTNALDTLATTLTNAVNSFNTSADLKADQTIASIPEDYTALVNEVTALKNLISTSVYNSFTDTNSSGTSYGYFSFWQGHTYKVENNTSGAINMYTTSSAESSGVVIDTIGEGIPAGQSVTFTATGDAPAYKIYKANSGNVVISDTGIGLDELQEQIEDIETFIKDNVFDGISITDSAGTRYYNFDFKQNNTYAFINNTSGAVNAYTKTRAGGSGDRIDTIGTGIGAGKTVYFTASADEPALEVYRASAGEVKILNITIGIPKLEYIISQPISFHNVINKITYLFNEKLSENNVSRFAGTNYTISDGVITYNRPNESGNDGFVIESHQSIENGALIHLELNVLQCTKPMSMYLYSYTDTRKFELISRIPEGFTGKYSIDVDLTWYSVYSEVDVNNYDIMFANTSGTGAVSFQMSDLKLFITDSNSFDIEEDLGSILEYLNATLSIVKTEVDIITSKTYVSPNGTKYIIAVNNNGSLTGIPVIPKKHVLIGNSLLAGFGSSGNTFGMAASDNTKDYKAHFYTYIHAIDSDYTQVALARSNWERATSLADSKNIVDTTIIPSIPNDTDLITIQLSDNVNTPESISVFENGGCLYLLQELRENFPNARVVWFGSWYQPDLIDTIVECCNNTGAEFISISDIATESINKAYIGKVYNRGTSEETEYTINSYTDDSTNHILTLSVTISGRTYSIELPYTSYTVNSATSISVTSTYDLVKTAGVASHPGDIGFAKIANRILFKLGISPTENAITIPEEQ